MTLSLDLNLKHLTNIGLTLIFHLCMAKYENHATIGVGKITYSETATNSGLDGPVDFEHHGYHTRVSLH